MYLSVPTPSLSTQKFYKIQINSNKLGKMRIKLEQTCGLTVVGRKQSDLTYNSTNYEGREQSDLIYNSTNYQ